MRSRWLNPDRLFLVAVLVPLLLLVGALIYYPAVNTFQTSLTDQNLRIDGQ